MLSVLLCPQHELVCPSGTRGPTDDATEAHLEMLMTCCCCLVKIIQCGGKNGFDLLSDEQP